MAAPVVLEHTVAGARRLLLLAGGIAASFVAYRWVHSRGLVAEHTQTSVGLASLILAGGALALAVSASVYGTHRWRWILFSSCLLATLLISGTRSTLIVLIVFPAVVLGGPGTLRWRLKRACAALAGCAALAVLSLSLLIPQFGIDSHALGERYATLTTPGFVVSSDDSFLERKAAYGVAAKAFDSQRLLGLGLGSRFYVGDSAIKANSDYTTSLDTPLELPAKVGAVGVLIVISYGLVLFKALRGSCPKGPSQERAFLSAVTALVVLDCLIVNPFADKGLGLLVVLLIAIVQPTAGQTPLHAGSSSPRPVSPDQGTE